MINVTRYLIKDSGRFLCLTVNCRFVPSFYQSVLYDESDRAAPMGMSSVSGEVVMVSSIFSMAILKDSYDFFIAYLLQIKPLCMSEQPLRKCKVRSQDS